MRTILRAVEFAAKAHGMTARKYAFAGRQTPYFVHCIRVMRKVDDYLQTWESAQRFRERAEPMLAVAVLHDTVEDTGATLPQIGQEFGPEVGDGLYWLTNPSKEHPHLRRSDRKQMDIEHLAESPSHWQVVKMFDRIDNLYDMLAAPPDFVMNVYLPESERLADVIGGADLHVCERLRSAIDWLRTITRVEWGKEEHRHATEQREA